MDSLNKFFQKAITLKPPTAEVDVVKFQFSNDGICYRMQQANKKKSKSIFQVDVFEVRKMGNQLEQRSDLDV